MKKRALITIILFLFLVYFSATTFFTFYALPNTYVNGYNMSFVEKSKIVDRNADIKTLTINASDNRKLVIDAQEVEFNLKIPEDFKIEQNPFSWPLSFFDTKKYTVNFDYTIDENKLNKKIYQAKLNQNSKKSYNAYISYLDDEYTIIPEQVGNEIDTNKLKDTIIKSLLEQKEDITLKDEYIKPTVYSNSWAIIRAKNKLNKLKDIEISFDFNDTIYKLKGRQLRDMMDFDEKKGFVYKDLEIEQYVDYLKDITDTYNKSRTITTVENKQLKLTAIDYGWEIDKHKTVELIKERIENAENETIEPAYNRQAKSRLKNDIQDEYIEIDQQNKTLYYINNYKINKSIPIKITQPIPKGIYNIDNKTKGYSKNYTLGFYRHTISTEQNSDTQVSPNLLESIYYDVGENIAVIVYWSKIKVKNF